MPGLLRGIARTAAIAGTATVVSNRVSRRQAGRWARKDQEQQAQQQQYEDEQAPPEDEEPPEAPEDMMSKRVEQLKALGELRSQGVLTEAEFASQKQLILS
jgi:hypothetical protein